MIPKQLRHLWHAINGRCFNPSNNRYGYYGARGVRVCDEWRARSSAFFNWALAAGWQPGVEIDRIDPDGDYSPNNCRFVTHRQNLTNRRKYRCNPKSDAGSKFKGVRRYRNLWIAQISVNGRTRSLGSFRKEDDAALAYDAAAWSIHGETARLNFGQDSPALPS